MVKFGVLVQTQGLHLHAKFHMNVFIVSASGGQKSHFGQILTFGGLLYRPPFTDNGQIWYAIADPCCTFVSIGLFCCPWRRKTPIFAIFGLRHLVVSPCSWRQYEKVDYGAQLQAFPCPTASKSFLYSNSFMAKSGAQTLTFKSVTNRHTNRQTDKQSQRFWPPRRRVKFELHQTWHGDRGPRARSCTSKTFGGLTRSFAARGR